MNLILNYKEIERMILAKSDKKIALSYVDSKTIKCTYTVSVFGFSKDLSVNAKILSVEDNVIKVGVADKMIIDMLSEQITKHIDIDKTGVTIEEGIFKIDLTKIDGVDKLLEHATFSDITIEERGLNIEALQNA